MFPRLAVVRSQRVATAPVSAHPKATDVVLEPPRDPHRISSFLNIRVADIHSAYDEWRRRGAVFLTPPKQHADEIRCYMRDPDGYLIEVGQLTDAAAIPR